MLPTGGLFPRRDRAPARRTSDEVARRADVARRAADDPADAVRWSIPRWPIWWPPRVYVGVLWSMAWPGVVVLVAWWLFSGRVAVGVALALLGLRWLTRPARRRSTSRAVARRRP